MDDFSVPGVTSYPDDAWVAPSNEANWIEPGKRPLSAMSPSIVTDEKVQLDKLNNLKEIYTRCGAEELIVEVTGQMLM